MDRRLANMQPTLPELFHAAHTLPPSEGLTASQLEIYDEFATIFDENPARRADLLETVGASFDRMVQAIKLGGTGSQAAAD